MEIGIASLFLVLAGMAYDRNSVGTMVACILVAVLALLSSWIDKAKARRIS